jgi:hypothetical protein
MKAPIILEARLLAETAGALRADSKMRNLPEEHFVQIVEWMLAGVPATKIVLLCEDSEENGGLGLPPVKAPGKSGLYRFWEVFAPFYLQAYRSWSKRMADQTVEDARKAPMDWDAATIETLRQRTFDALSDPTEVSGLTKALVQGFVKVRSQELDREKLALATRKVELMEKRESALKDTLNNKELSPEERERKIRETFGMA